MIITYALFAWEVMADPPLEIFLRNLINPRWQKCFAKCSNSINQISSKYVSKKQNKCLTIKNNHMLPHAHKQTRIHTTHAHARAHTPLDT